MMFCKNFHPVPSPLAMILIGRGHRIGGSLDDLERVAKVALNSLYSSLFILPDPADNQVCTGALIL